MEVNCNGGHWRLGWTNDSRATNFCNNLWSFGVVGIFKERLKN